MLDRIVAADALVLKNHVISIQDTDSGVSTFVLFCSSFIVEIDTLSTETLF